MYDEIPVHVLRTGLRRVLDDFLAGSKRVMITRNGREVAALVSPDDLRALERADNSRMEYHEQMQEAKLREICWLKEGLDGERYEVSRHRE